jgi:peptide/nickel transport system permease protein
MSDSIGPNILIEDEERTEVPLSAAALFGEEELPVKQIGQMALVWRRFRRHKAAMVGAIIFLVMCVMAIIGPYIAPESFYGYNPITGNNHTPDLNSWRYLLGGDFGGHSVLMWVLRGARTSLTIGVVAGLISTILGIFVGAIAGYFGGFLDSVMMRLTDVFLTLPFLPLLLVLSKFFQNGGGATFVIVIFSVLGWPGVARLIRSYYLTFREQEFTDAARAVGVGPWRIIFFHILPNSLSPIIVSFTLAVAAFIGTETAIDFLGLGLKPGQGDYSWGLAMAQAEAGFLVGNWWMTVFPGCALLLTILSVNFLGDGLRDALDVKAKATE